MSDTDRRGRAALMTSQAAISPPGAAISEATVAGPKRTDFPTMLSFLEYSRDGTSGVVGESEFMSA